MSSRLIRTCVILGLLMARDIALHGQALGPDSAGVLGSLSAVANLPMDQASRSLPVKIKATVTYHDHDRGLLFLQDGQSAASVRLPLGKENEDVYFQAGQ